MKLHQIQKSPLQWPHLSLINQQTAKNFGLLPHVGS